MINTQPSRVRIYAVILTLFFLEITLFDKLRILGVRPELLLVATLFFGFHYGPGRGAEAGCISGVLKDIFSSGPFGINAFAFLFIGFFAGLLKDKLFKDNFVTQFFLSSVAVYIASVVYFLYLNEITPSVAFAGFWKMCLYKGLYTGFLAPLFFLALAKIFESEEKEYI